MASGPEAGHRWTADSGDENEGLRSGRWVKMESPAEPGPPQGDGGGGGGGGAN